MSGRDLFYRIIKDDTKDGDQILGAMLKKDEPNNLYILYIQDRDQNIDVFKSTPEEIKECLSILESEEQLVSYSFKQNLDTTFDTYYIDSVFYSKDYITNLVNQVKGTLPIVKVEKEDPNNKITKILVTYKMGDDLLKRAFFYITFIERDLVFEQLI